MTLEPITASIRFGYGPRPGESVGPDAAAWLRGQLQGPDPAASAPGTPAAVGLQALRDDEQDRKQKLKPDRVRRIFLAETLAIADHMVATTTPFRERLVWFWFNHFTVSLKRPFVAAVLGDYVRSAIRPHVTGRFEDMVLAVMRHPAMLLYLDNAQSFGPDSLIGERRHKGLNENLARECMELHTVTPASGYTQADVTSFANILTGWGIAPPKLLDEGAPAFRFFPAAHEPGSQVVMGHRFAPGEAGGEAALRFLANHPSTYHSLATKLATHFVADVPPPDVVARLRKVLADTRGDLKAVSLALVDEPAAATPLTKLRAPSDYVLATARALNLPAERRIPVLQAMAGLGQNLFAAPLPNGWPDTAADWSAGEAMMLRVDWSYDVAARAETHDPVQVADAVLGPLLSPSTRDAVHRAGSRRDGLTLLFASPEFMRR
jgi:uncharacterized protein (DUF1800 family)